MTKRTPLFHDHLRLDAKLVEFAGFEMPIHYTGILAEHQAVRERAGLFDVSHMGRIDCRGADTGAMVQSLTPNDVTRLTDGKAQYSMFLNDRGGIIDDIIVYRHAADHYLLIVNAGNLETDWHWLMAHQRGDVVLKNRSDETALLALQGPAAAAILAGLTSVALDTLPAFHFVEADVAGIRVTITRTGYTGEEGFELVTPAAKASAMWNALLDAGRPRGLLPCGLGARDTLRLEMCYRLHGHDMNDQTTPFEAGLDWVVKMAKGDFIGRAALEQQRAEGCKRLLVALRLMEEGIPREGYPILAARKPVGYVTSGTMSPTLRKGIGLGYVPPQFRDVGTKFSVDIRGRERLAEVVAMPFYRREKTTP